ncbi:response regulator [Alkalicaulis satelles]|uniref:Response regulator n=1 Tax=Alkalicaulis satelles TaxID=2609175 RepID=A0A5M6ZIB8_9PROT|nr:response regulator [Alkalicaulis satelles]KAA5803447.1 response regulator [Alkalicaulis satelles]
MAPELNVLHVEDDFADAMLLQQALRDAGGYGLTMEVVRTLRDAAFKLRRRAYDLIIADLRLPDSTDPNETVGLLQSHAGEAPILVLTGSAGVDEERIGTGVNLLDKNLYFSGKGAPRRARELLAKVMEAAASRHRDALMI